MTMTMNNNIIYFHINNVTGEVFYVGIGKEKRSKSKKNRNKHWHNIVKKYDYDIMIEESGLTWDQASELEKYWIKRIGRKDLGLGTLVNMTDGGDGRLGIKHSDETKNKIRNKLIGYKQSQESIFNMVKTKFKALLIDGIHYSSIKEASEILNINRQIIGYRLANPKYDNYKTEE